jgi:hypothetical protein
MKRSLLVAVFSVWMVCGAQVNFPTVREVYDFAVGDTFEYRFAESQGYSDYHFQVITNRSDYGSDSIVYTTTNSFSNPPSINASSFTIKNLNQAYYFNWHLSACPSCSIDSSSVTTNASDTFFSTYIHRYPGPAVYRLTCLVGFGETLNSVIYYGFVVSGHSTSLIYAHKSNGQIFGTPHYFPVGVEKIRNSQSAIRISPNPATTTITLQLQQTPAPATAFQLFDITGRMVLQKPLTETTSRIELNGVSKGMYLYNVMSDTQKVKAGKLVVE